MKRQNIILAISIILLSSCKKTEEESIATGIFEATETTVSAEQNGKLVQFTVTEGQTLASGQEVGLVDTVPLMLKLAQVGATRQVYDAQKPDQSAQIAALEAQLVKAKQEQQRFSELVADGAAPSKSLDDARSQVTVLQKQIAALKSSLNTQVSTLDSQQKTTDTEKAILHDQLRKCHITAPLSGTVLEKYVEQGEVIGAGRPLFKMADTKNMFLRAYVTSSQLATVKVGQRIKVRTDYGDGQGKEYEGTISWISNKSEFTPKTILTDDERADLVYAMKIAVKNDDYIKIGMYGRAVLPNP